VLCQRVTLYFKILCVTVGGNAANSQKKAFLFIVCSLN